MKKNSIIAVVVSLIIISSAIVVFTTNLENDTDVPSGNKESNKKSPEALGNITSFDEAVNAFSFELFNKLSDDPQNDGNVFYSPYSVFTALAMTYEGARGDTAVEMGNVLHIDQDNDSFHEYMQALYNFLNYNDEYDISTANALWPDVGFELLDDYVNIIETYYGGKASEVEYGDPVEAARIINEWVENQTNNLIKNLVPAGAIDPDLTRLILTNAIYFKGVWQVQFEEANTTLRDFELSPGDVLQVDTMKLTGTEDKFNYTSTDDLKILELPYTGNEISMMILLPNKGVDLDDVVDSMNWNEYDSWIDSMYETKADIYLPKFKFETSYGLNGYLKDLGMVDAFGNADFSGIDGTKELFISQVLHKAFIDVNEEGTEAAAATAVIMAGRAPGPTEPPERITFNCNHPFLFTLHHKETRSILFMGKVMNPEYEELGN